MQIRDAEPRDAAAIAAIYNDAVANTTAVWHSRQVTAAERAAWIAQRQTDGFPVLVAESGESALGYATYGPFRAFEGYRHTAELSIYVDARARESWRGGGRRGEHELPDGRLRLPALVGDGALEIHEPHVRGVEQRAHRGEVVALRLAEKALTAAAPEADVAAGDERHRRRGASSRRGHGRRSRGGVARR